MRSDAFNRGGRLEQESLLPELLHALNQPLTSLRCSLEVTLLQPRDSEEYRNRLRESLKLTEDIMVLSHGIRELIDVERPHGTGRPIALDKILRSAVRELLPLTDTQGIGLSLLCRSSLPAFGDAEQLFMAAMYFLSFLLGLAGKGDEVSVQGSTESDASLLTFELTKQDNPALTPEQGCREKPATATAYLKLLVARRVFEIAGGEVFVEREPRRVSVQVRLPRVQSESDRSMNPDACGNATQHTL